MKRLILALGLHFAIGVAQSAPDEPTITREFAWSPAEGEGVPTARICPLKYDKRWAYSVEIDDGPGSTATVSQPLLARFSYTDAPPGMAGGKPLPFVGCAAVFPARVDVGGPEYLSWDQLRTLKAKGWEVVNHGYAHVGNHWEPNGGLTDGEVRRELFWSQAIFAEEVGGGADLTHFVYPNGYLKYKGFLGEFGLTSASRFGAKSRKPNDPDFDALDLDRNNLDEAAWKPSGDAMAGMPAEPEAGALILDFTHGMEADPQSANHRRWVERLGRIAATHGEGGRDTLWSAPTPEILRYVSAAKQAKVSCRRGCVSLTLPRQFSDVALTLQLTGVPEASKLSIPGGTVHRKGDEAWITPPALPSASPSKQPLKRIYRGPVRDVQFERDESIAGVRLLQRGRPRPGFAPKISLVKPDGRVEPLPATTPVEAWGFWQLSPILPGRPAILASSLNITPDPAFTEMEIWATVDRP